MGTEAWLPMCCPPPLPIKQTNRLIYLNLANMLLQWMFKWAMDGKWLIRVTWQCKYAAEFTPYFECSLSLLVKYELRGGPSLVAKQWQTAILKPVTTVLEPRLKISWLSFIWDVWDHAEFFQPEHLNACVLITTVHQRGGTLPTRTQQRCWQQSILVLCYQACLTWKS